MAETKTTIHTKKLMTGLRLSEPNDYNIFLHFNCPSFNGLLETIAPTTALRNTCTKQSLSVSIYPLC
jgi:hypothetical protein